MHVNSQKKKKKKKDVSLRLLIIIKHSASKIEDILEPYNAK